MQLPARSFLKLGMISCPVCSASGVIPLCTVRGVPLIGCQFAESAARARSAECGDLELVACGDCEHIYNRVFEPEKVLYAPGYENALGFSARYRAEMETTADRLIHEYSLRDKSILEIGCGAADFLTTVCRKGANRGVGYDPTQKARVEAAGLGIVTVKSEAFRDRQEDPADLLCALHVLEHLSKVVEMLRLARARLKSTGVGFFQVPNGLAIFRGLNIWDLTYEHVSYFSSNSLHSALSAAGFSTLRLEESFGGQYLNADVASAAESRGCVERSTEEIWSVFPEAFERVTESWRRQLSRLFDEGSRTVVWGAGTKAVTFLNLLGVRSGGGVDYAVDINPRKAGRYIPGSAQQIVPPEFLRDYRPDTIIVMNGEYVPEIRHKLSALQLDCRLIVASPGQVDA